jgi:hypothetical protein
VVIYCTDYIEYGFGKLPTKTVGSSSIVFFGNLDREWLRYLYTMYVSLLCCEIPKVLCIDGNSKCTASGPMGDKSTIKEAQNMVPVHKR